MRDIVNAVSIINTILETNFMLDLRRDVDSINLQSGYKVSGRKDALRVLESVEMLPDSFELAQFTGRKVGGTINLFPIRNYRSLMPNGLVEVSIKHMSGPDYNVQCMFSLPKVYTISNLLKTGEEKSSLLISDLEESTEIC